MQRALYSFWDMFLFWPWEDYIPQNKNQQNKEIGAVLNSFRIVFPQKMLRKLSMWPKALD